MSDAKRRWRLPEALRLWFSAEARAAAGEPEASAEKRVDWLRCLPFIAMHVGCLAVVVVGWSPVALATAAGLYLVRMFAVTAFYHRYFSHRAYRTSRVFQFVLAVLSQSSAQKSVLWWASKHRHHHLHSDTEADVHSPRHRGFIYSHLGWIFSRRNDVADLVKVADFACEALRHVLVLHLRHVAKLRAVLREVTCLASL